jgi:hypothetical protein
VPGRRARGGRAHNEGVYASALTPDQEGELRALRARAFGPGADILSDPIALARLRELEGLGHPEVAAVAGGTEAPRETPEPELAVTPVPAGIPASSTDEGAVDSTDGGSSRGKRVRAWLGSVTPAVWVIAASSLLVVAVLVWGIGRLAAPGSDLSLGQIETDDEPPSMVGTDGLTALYDVTTDGMRAHESYRTIAPWSWSAPDGTRCLFLTVDGFDRVIDGACAPAGLDPIAHITVWPGFSDELVGDLPQGSVIRFALVDERVHVWVGVASERR